MNLKNKQHLLEISIYIIGWLLVFLAPIFDSFLSKEEIIKWFDVLRAWLYLLPFALFFFIHNYIARKFFLNKRYLLYTSFTLALILAIFISYPRVLKNEIRSNPIMKDMVRMKEFKGPDRNFVPPPDSMRVLLQSNRVPPPSFRHRPILELRALDSLLSSLLIAILLAGFNLAIKLYFRLLDEQNKQRELESSSLLFELEYLKGQLNPHFFMNMLNNIHALIDIDSEKAKETIIGFSKLMRYVLYDANQQEIQLSREITFLRNYIDLMKIRYTKNVDINIHLPERIPDITIPPLLFVSFIENAFKHGISYRNKSYVNLELRVSDNEIICNVSNSVWRPISDNSSDINFEDPESGIGLSNVIKRLDLIYGNRYSLSIDKSEKNYCVKLTIPVK